jgi:hypothetical protein
MIQLARKGTLMTSGVTSLNQSSIGHALVQRKHHFTNTPLMLERRMT